MTFIFIYASEYVLQPDPVIILRRVNLCNNHHQSVLLSINITNHLSHLVGVGDVVPDYDDVFLPIIVNSVGTL